MQRYRKGRTPPKPWCLRTRRFSSQANEHIFLGSQYSSGLPSTRRSQLRVHSRAHITSPAESLHPLPKGPERVLAIAGGSSRNPRKAACPPTHPLGPETPVFPKTSEHRTLQRQPSTVTPPLPLFPSAKQDHPSSRRWLQKLRRTFLTPTGSPEACAAQHGRCWFSCSERRALLPFRELSW